MQIRLTVLGPRSGRACDVLVTAPADTALGTVAGALAASVGSGQPVRSSGSAVALYAGAERLDPQTARLGVPPLVDGAVLSVHTAAEPEHDDPDAAARLQVVGGPDAGGVHLLHGGQVRIGRSVEADVPIDDPDVSRLHCVVTVDPGGQITVADLGSTNGTRVDGRPVGDRPIPLPPGALLRIGESTLRLESAAAPDGGGPAAPPPPPPALAVLPDNEGHLQVVLPSPTDYGTGSYARVPAPRGPGLPPGQTAPHGTGSGSSPAQPGRAASSDGTAAQAPGGEPGARDGELTSGHAAEAPHGGTGNGQPPAPAGDFTGVPGPIGAAARGSDAPAGNAAMGPGRHDTGSEAGPGRRTEPSAGPERAGTAAHQTRGAASPDAPTTHTTGTSPGPRPTTAPDAAPDTAHARHANPGAGPDNTRAGTGAHPASAAEATAPHAPGSTPGRTTGPDGTAQSVQPGPGTAANAARAHADTPLGTGASPQRPTAADVPTAPGAAPAAGAPASRTATRDRLAAVARDAVTMAGRGGVFGETPGARGGLSGAIGALARRLASGRGAGRGDRGRSGHDRLTAEAAALRERAPDPAAVLVTALGPGPRLWERGCGHPDALAVRLGSTDLPTDDGLLPSVPVTVGLRGAGSLGIIGPRPRLSGLARSVVAQLCALHSPATLELVLISADRSRGMDQRADEWSWLNWLPHLRPAHGQDCRLLLAFDREQAEARTAELARRLDDGPLGAGWPSAEPEAVAAVAAGRSGPYTVVVVDGDPGSATLRESVARLAHAGPAAGIHLVCLAESADRLAARCGALARLEGDVATTLALAPEGPARAVVDAVSGAWAERFGRALAPLREADAVGRRGRSALPDTARLLDQLDLALATPSKISARWTDEPTAPRATLGAGPEGTVAVDLAAEGPHLLVGGAPGAGKTELLRSVAAALAAAARPDELTLVLVDGSPERGEGLRVCTDLPHVSTYLAASDPSRMREFAQALAAELKRREELLGGESFESWHAQRRLAEQLGIPRTGPGTARPSAEQPSAEGAVKLRSREAAALPRLVVIVDDFDALTAPALGSPGRPAAGSVVRAVEALARAGARLGVHLVVSTGRPERTAGTEADDRSRLRIALRTEDPESAALLVHVEEPAGLAEQLPGRGYLRRPDGAVTPFQAGRVSGRIPRTATLRPTVVPVEWERMGDPPTRRPVRELGNGPTDLALLASALQRAAESVGADSPEALV
ncbi:FtsK/SpoIIIE domain-containing protein [Streptantibioticus ferralitis]|uniref:FtsK/SpoIIIE domain-containing protein n=1 Tax=Streptantibioticus ferralitis TaxID=236510 RepID=A0ABT5YUG8_9ACTN|nr:FtsK/SpoIIIE domain-containing protein [Streptantibioticus ferralitis]MDF2255247.1 FtsK/SpoIIIE domain-containing protein [Streptantibioticus ferralitis]